MNPYYPHLFSPLTVGSLTFKNRIFCAPSNHCMQGTEPYPTEAAIRYYAEKARGGAATVIAGSCIPDPKRNDPRCARIPKWNQYNIHDPYAWRYFRQQTDAIHYFDAKASFEFHMPPRGGFVKSDLSWTRVYGPSAMVMPDGLVVDEMPEEEMDRIAEAYADGAEAVVRCGFDMLLLHGGHGMMIEQFLSPLYNRRTDRYGGILENRARFPRMIVERIRQRVGRQLVLEYRISGSELTEGGLAPEESRAFIRLIQDQIDLVHVSAGDASNPHTRAVMHPSGFLPPAPNAYLAKSFKEDPEIRIPVVTVGAIYHPDVAERLLAEGWADVVSTARGLIADPEYPEKARRGRADDITPCIKCFHCLDDHKKNHYFSCSVNPLIGRQHRMDFLVHPPAGRKKVAVIGGGPAGMKAALVAAERGHRVTLYEQSGALGGQLRFSEHVSFKYDLHHFLQYLIRQVEQSPVEVRLNTRATPELLAEEPGGYDAVLAALGAEPVCPPIPGAELPQVLTAPQVYHAPEAVGRRVVIVGGGQVGCETALCLAEQGRAVTLLEMGSRLAPDAIDTYRTPLIDHLDAQTTYYTGSRCTAITPDGVRYEAQDGSAQTLEADTVILAAGMRGKSAEAEAFRDSAFDFCAIGDCVRARNVKQAIHTAFDAASRL